METATLANGCFWCTEAVFKRVKGIEKVTSGYTGGQRENPSWEQVISEATGHVESLQVIFDPSVISYERILDIFFATHDPTTKDRQGYDVGAMYRSAIFYHNEEQKKAAEKKIKKLQPKYEDPIVTEITPYTAFYKAEGYHQNFYESGQRPDYCRIIIDPKIKKLLTQFSDEVKEEYK
jgi:peptide-methionine (S)-S-oxide reductase